MKKRFHCLAQLLSLLMILQSCTVYHSYTSSADQAIASMNKVKIKIIEDDPYKFKQLLRFEGEVYGLAKSNSDTYKRLTSRKMIKAENEVYRYVKLNEDELNRIQLENKGLSTTLNIVVPVVVVAGVIAVFYATYDPF